MPLFRRLSERKLLERLSRLANEIEIGTATPEGLKELESLLEQTAEDINRGNAKEDLIDAYEDALNALTQKRIKDRNWPPAKSSLNRLINKAPRRVSSVINTIVEVLKNPGGSNEAAKIEDFTEGCSLLFDIGKAGGLNNVQDVARTQLSGLTDDIPSIFDSPNGRAIAFHGISQCLIIYEALEDAASAYYQAATQPGDLPDIPMLSGRLREKLEELVSSEDSTLAAAQVNGAFGLIYLRQNNWAEASPRLASALNVLAELHAQRNNLPPIYSTMMPTLAEAYFKSQQDDQEMLEAVAMIKELFIHEEQVLSICLAEITKIEETSQGNLLAQAHLLRANLELLSGNDENASKALQELFPLKDVVAQWSSLTSEFQHLIESLPESADKLLLKADQLAIQGDVSSAIEWYLQAAEAREGWELPEERLLQLREAGDVDLTAYHALRLLAQGEVEEATDGLRNLLGLGDDITDKVSVLLFNWFEQAVFSSEPETPCTFPDVTLEWVSLNQAHDTPFVLPAKSEVAGKTGNSDSPWTQTYIRAIIPLWRQGPEGEMAFQAGDVGPTAQALAQWVINVSDPLKSLLPIAFRTLFLLSTTEEERKSLLKTARESLDKFDFDQSPFLQMVLCVSDLMASLSLYAEAVIALHTAEMSSDVLRRLDALGAFISEEGDGKILASVSEEKAQPLSEILGNYIRIKRQASVAEVEISSGIAFLDVLLTIAPATAVEYIWELDLPAWNTAVAEYMLEVTPPEELGVLWEKIRFRAADISNQVEEAIEAAKTHLRAELPLESLLEKHTDMGEAAAHLASAEIQIESGNGSRGEAKERASPLLMASLSIASTIDELLGEDLTPALRNRIYQALMAVVEDTGACTVEARVLAARYAADNSGWFNALRDVLFDHGIQHAERISQLAQERLTAMEATSGEAHSFASLLLGAAYVFSNRDEEAYHLGHTLEKVEQRVDFDRFMEETYTLAAEKAEDATLQPEPRLYRRLHQVREGTNSGKVGLDGLLNLLDTTPDLAPVADEALTASAGWEDNPWASLALAVIRDGDIELLEKALTSSKQVDILEEIVAFAEAKFLPPQGEPVEGKDLLAHAVIGGTLATLGGRQNIERALEHFAKIEFSPSGEETLWTAKIEFLQSVMGESYLSRLSELTSKCEDEGELDLAGEAYFLVGQVHIAMGQLAEAANTMGEALNLYPELAQRIEPLSDKLAAQEPDEPTILQLRRRIAKTLKDDETLLRLCRHLIELNCPEGIADELEEMATKHDEDPIFAGSAYLTAGLAGILEDEDERAVLAFERALDKDENLRQHIENSLAEATSGERPRVILLEFLARLQEGSGDYIETNARYMALIKDDDVDKTLEIAQKTLDLAVERGDDVLLVSQILDDMLTSRPDNSAVAHAVVRGKLTMLDREAAIMSLRPLLLEVAQGEAVDILTDGLVELNPEPATEKTNALAAGAIIIDKQIPHLVAKAAGLLLPAIDEIDKTRDEQAPEVADRLIRSLSELETTTQDKHPDLLEAEALAYSILGNPDKAAELFRAALARRGEPMSAPERRQDVHERLERTLNRFSDSPGIQFVLAESYIAQDIEPEKSVELLESAHSTIRPNLQEPAAEHPAFKVLELYEYLGEKLRQLQRYARAISIYRLAIAENPHSRELRELLWKSKKLFIEQIQKSVKDIEEEQIPGEKQLEIGSWHVNFGFPFGIQMALSWFARASKKTSTREAGLIGQARCFLAMSASGPALKTLEQLDENAIDPEYRPALLELLGRAHEGLGHYGKAAEYFSILLAENPEHPDFAVLHRKLAELQSQTELIWSEPQVLLPELSLIDLFAEDE